MARMLVRSRNVAVAGTTAAVLFTGVVLARVPAGTDRPPATAPDLQAAPLAPDARWRRADDAWSDGRYPDALEDLIGLARSSAEPEYHSRIAQLTGELYVTTELTTDGRNPDISADGQYATYQTGPANDPVTRLVQVAPAPRIVAELPTATSAFDPTGKRLAWLRTGPASDPTGSQIVVRDLATSAERVWLGAGLLKSSLDWSADGTSLTFLGATAPDADRTDAYRVRDGGTAEPLTTAPGFKTNLVVDPHGRALVYTSAPVSPFQGRGGRGGRGGGRGSGRGRGGAGVAYTVVDLATHATHTVSGSALTMSADGGTIAWLERQPDQYTLQMSKTLSSTAATVRTGADRIDAPALSPDGSHVAYQFMGGVGSATDWEIYVSDAAGTHQRVTRDIQHDVLPQFLGPDRLLGMKGEARHRRSYVYDLGSGDATRIFSNDTIRTISPEYVWVPSADGRHLIIQAERDGDTVSPERGIYVVDLTRTVSRSDLLSRLTRQLADETDLRTRMTRAYAPIAAEVRFLVDGISPYRVYDYQKAQFDFDSKYVSQPGNAKAIDYLQKMYASFGYTPELQWFQPAQAQGNRTANVVSTLRGTENPDLIYVVSSHFDSVVVGPGADDDTSGTCALLETARVLAGHPLPATVVFASFTGEEAGLLGSREFVRLAAERKWNIAGALNNDMIGWAGESARMDNTIRYSNAGIKDLQHGAAFLFTKLVTYDAKYYKSTDAQAFYDGWGDIVGGIGSYPVLANPNYHQPTDLLETIDFRQVAETAKVTAATIMYLASSPSRLKDLNAARTGSGVELTWTPSPEQGITGYVVAYGPDDDPLHTRVTVTGPRATLPAVPAGTQIAVKAVNRRGLEGWDWARTSIR